MFLFEYLTIFAIVMIWQLFWSFFKIGLFTFGSGYAMIPLIEKEVVGRKKWFGKDDFYDQFTLAQSSPGPFSVNTAVFVGYKMGGWWGAFFSVLGVVLPSFIIILLIAVFLVGYRNNPYVLAAFNGMRPAVVALIAYPFIKLFIKLNWWQMIVAAAVAVAIWWFGVSPMYLLLGAAIIGIVYTLYNKRQL